MVKLITCTCRTCGIEFKTYLSDIKVGKGKHCSVQCYREDTKPKESKICKTCNQLFFRKPRRNLKTWEKAEFCSKSCALTNKVFTKERKSKISEALQGKPNYKNRGENHYRWNGGSGTFRHQAMGKIEYRLWRTAVFMRDNYTCVKCESKKYLQADHIKPWSKYPELRYAIDNGRTLCLLCHQKTESFPKQFIKKEGLS